MMVNVIKEKIRSITDDAFGLEPYAVVKSGNAFEYQFLNVNENLIDALKSEVKSQLVSKFLDNDISIKGITDIADNQADTYYEFTKHESFNGLDFLFDSHEKLNGNKNTYFKIPTSMKIVGFIFKIGYDDNIILVYQHFYPTSQIKVGQTIVLTESENTEEITNVTKDMIRLTKNIDILSIDDSLFTSNIKLIERSFKFTQYIFQEAAKVVASLKKFDSFKNFDKVDKYFSTPSNLSKVKKVMQSKNSPIFLLTNEELISSIQSHDRYKEKFVIENNLIDIRKNKDVEALIELLTDSILMSQITKKEYSADVKKILPDVAI